MARYSLFSPFTWSLFVPDTGSYLGFCSVHQSLLTVVLDTASRLGTAFCSIRHSLLAVVSDTGSDAERFKRRAGPVWGFQGVGRRGEAGSGVGMEEWDTDKTGNRCNVQGAGMMNWVRVKTRNR